MKSLSCLLDLWVGASVALGQGLPVAATTGVIADLVREVAGGRVALTVVVPMGSDPHSFEPRPSSLRGVARARVLFANGLYLEPFLPKLEAALPWGSRTVLLAEGQPGLICITPEQHAQEARQGLDVHRHGLCDLHLWLDPGYALAYARRIHDTLAALDTAGAPAYAGRLRDFARRLEAVDRAVQECLAAVPRGRLRVVVQHDAFQYAARHYGFQVVGSLAGFAGQDRGLRNYLELARRLEQEQVRVIISEPQFGEGEVRALAEASGARVVRLYSDALTREVPTYLDLLRHNGQALCEAFR